MSDADAGCSAAAVVRALADRSLTVATAESLTAGLVSARLADVPGASALLRGGVVAYASDVKADVLGVGAALLAAGGAVQAEVAVSMARGAARLLGASCAVATTGVAGPAEQDGRAVGTVFVAVDDAAGGAPVVREHRFAGDRAAVRAAATVAAVTLLGAWARERPAAAGR